MPAANSDGEPAAKRVRFDKSSPGEPGQPGSSASTATANDVMQLRFVRSPDDVHEDGARGEHNAALSCRPAFTHQIFRDEVIRNVTDASVVALYFTCSSLTCWLDSHIVCAPGFPSTGLPKVDAKSRDKRRFADESPMQSVPATVAKFIHAGRVHSREEFIISAREDDMFNPPFADKDCISTYDVKPGHTFSVFRRSLASCSTVRDFHKRMQLLMFLHIDGASFIDDTDPRWELFVTLEHVCGAPRRLVGYATVYPFSSMRPGKTLDAGFGERIRISQVFIVPRYQRGGHGGRLLNAIYLNAAARKAIEVTVEDPSEGFRLLRDRTDLPRAYEAGILDKEFAGPVGNSDPVAAATAVAAVQARLRNELLLTKAQARRCVEVHRLRFIDRENDASSYKTYRLWVKRRLYDEYLEVLDAYSDKDERKAKLAEIYSGYEKEYLQIVIRLNS